jgi:cytosylglucuronate decarboxylase
VVFWFHLSKFLTAGNGRCMNAQASTQLPGPRVLIIRILEACDAGCFMCPFRHSADAYRFPVSAAVTLAEAASQSTIRLVRITGGEPLLHDDIGAIVRTFAQQGLLVSLITNGSRLAQMSDVLTTEGLSQVIVSLDGRGAAHDRFRDHPGLFDAAVKGIETIRRIAPNVRTRVNTVIGPHNMDELLPIYQLLCDLEVDAWSLIPLKRADGAWEYSERQAVERVHKHLIARASGSTRPRLLGHSLHWIGRDQQERDDFLQGRKIMTPRNRCGVVNLLRYYTPRDGQYFACNCVPHRVGSQSLGQAFDADALTSAGLGAPGQWLNENGPAQCLGCEPINAALGEGEIDLDTDPFGF